MQNVCGYRESYFEINPELSLFFGPNGIGKSTILDVANICASPRRFQGRDTSILFRKMIFHKDYNPGYSDYGDFDNVMRMEAVFDTDEGDKQVVVELDPDKASLVQHGYLPLNEIGIVKNELPPGRKVNAYYADADNPANLTKFQINVEVGEKFLDIARAVYGYDCKLEQEVEEFDSELNEYVTFYTDFIINKPYDNDNVRVHFRRMSAGERKIATLIAELCSPLQQINYDIYLIDNIEMHVYFKRHTKMIDKIREHFPDKQILATTHSGEIVRYLDEKYLYDIEKYRGIDVCQT